MIWKTTEKVQYVSALLCQVKNVSPILERLMSGPKAYQDVEFAQGENWQVFFGAVHNPEEVILPPIAQAEPLFRAFPDIWMPVGTGFNLPSRLQQEYIEMMRSDNELEGHELIIVPLFSSDANMTEKADIFVIQQKLAMSEIALEKIA